MKIYIIYDSFFGNTEKIAQAINKSLKTTKNETELLHIDKAVIKDLKDADLIVLGSPTRAFRPTEKLQAFLRKLKKENYQNTKFVSFDTRVSLNQVNSKILNVLVKFFGYATNYIDKSIKSKSLTLINNSTGFFVDDKEGPLKNGEEKRASVWIQNIIKNI